MGIPVSLDQQEHSRVGNHYSSITAYSVTGLGIEIRQSLY